MEVQVLRKVSLLLLVSSLLVITWGCEVKSVNQDPPKQTVTPAPTEPAKETPANPSPPTDSKQLTPTKPTKPTPSKTLASEIYEEAKLGKLFFCEFGIGTDYDTIEKKWGKPDEGSTKESKSYQSSHSCDFYLDSSQKVMFISSDHPKFQMIPIENVKKELGAPIKKQPIPDENLEQWIYQAGKYQVIYVYEVNDKIVRYIELKK